MSCYFRHMKDVFQEAGVEPGHENKKILDRLIHEWAGVQYKHCPAAWKAVKAGIRSDKARRRQLIEALRQSTSER